MKRGLWIAGGVAGVAALGAAGLAGRYLAKGCSLPPLPPPAADRAFVAALQADGQQPDATFATGCHNAPFWQSGMHDNLAFASRSLR